LKKICLWRKIDPESRQAIARWMYNGFNGNETPSILGVKMDWPKSLGPPKKKT